MTETWRQSCSCFAARFLCMMWLNWNAGPDIHRQTKILQCRYSCSVKPYWSPLQYIIPQLVESSGFKPGGSLNPAWDWETSVWVAGRTHNEVEQNVSWASNQSTKTRGRGVHWCAVTRTSRQGAVIHQHTQQPHHRQTDQPKWFQVEGPIK